MLENDTIVYLYSTLKKQYMADQSAVQQKYEVQ